MNKQLKLFMKISIAEGISFLLLLLIAMPLKYLADLPLAVKYVGWLHGLLFIIYLFQLLYLTIELKWRFKRLITPHLCSAFIKFPWLSKMRVPSRTCRQLHRFKIRRERQADLPEETTQPIRKRVTSCHL